MSDDPTPGELPRSFGMATATFVVVASMVGTGVLTTSGFTIFFVGSNLAMLVLWVVGAAIAICGALSLAELAAAIPRSGGDYVFLREAYGPLASFLSGWVSFLIGFGAPIAASAVAAGRYFLDPFVAGPAAEPIVRGLATALIVLFGLIHSASRSASIGTQGAATIVKVGILAALAAAGLAAGSGRWERLADPLAVDQGLLTSAFFSLVYIYYAYTGWNGAAYIAGEVEDPQRKMPRAILLGTGLVTLLYLALNAMYAYAVTPDYLGAIVEEAGGDVNALTPIAEIAATRLFGDEIAAGLSIVVGLTLLASLSAFVLTGPRVIHAMAEAGQFPKVAGRLSGPSKTPAVATAMQVGWSLVLVWTGTFENILIYAGVGLALFSMLTISGVYVLRVRRPDLPRPFRTPGYPLVPAFYLIMTAALTAAAFSERPEVSVLSLASIAAGIPIASRARLAHAVGASLGAFAVFGLWTLGPDASARGITPLLGGHYVRAFAVLAAFALLVTALRLDRRTIAGQVATVVDLGLSALLVVLAASFPPPGWALAIAGVGLVAPAAFAALGIGSTRSSAAAS